MPDRSDLDGVNRPSHRWETALGLIQAMVLGDEAATVRAYHRLQRIWTQRELDAFTRNLEEIFRMNAG